MKKDKSYLKTLHTLSIYVICCGTSLCITCDHVVSGNLSPWKKKLQALTDASLQWRVSDMISKKTCFLREKKKSAYLNNQPEGKICTRLNIVCIEVISVIDINDYLEKLLNSWDAKQVPY